MPERCCAPRLDDDRRLHDAGGREVGLDVCNMRGVAHDQQRREAGVIDDTRQRPAKPVAVADQRLKLLGRLGRR